MKKETEDFLEKCQSLIAAIGVFLTILFATSLISFFMICTTIGNFFIVFLYFLGLFSSLLIIILCFKTANYIYSILHPSENQNK